MNIPTILLIIWGFGILVLSSAWDNIQHLRITCIFFLIFAGLFAAVALNNKLKLDAVEKEGEQ